MTTLTTQLAWQPPADAMPDADESVLLWLHCIDHTPVWESGWFDGEHWRLCESGGIVDGRVLYWARPVGPGDKSAAVHDPERIALAEYIIGAFERGADPADYGRDIAQFRGAAA